MLKGLMMSEKLVLGSKINGRSISSTEETPAKQTVMPLETARYKILLALSSSGLLMRSALSLFSERIRESFARPHLGRGTGSNNPLKILATLFCPLDSERVALALTTGEKGCSCSPSYRTPTARDWKGMSAKSWSKRRLSRAIATLADQVGGAPHPEFLEELMGFPTGWTELDH